MENKLELIFKGFIVGLGKIIPGVSGSLIAVSLGIYEKSIECISHFFKDVRNNLYFLGLIGIGVVLAVILGSKVIILLINNFYLPTMFLFIGLIAGGIPDLLKEKKNKSILDVLLIIISFSIVLIIGLLGTTLNFNPTKNASSLFIISGIGFIDAATMVIPGISGTAIFILLGCYDFVLNLFSNLLNFDNFLYILFFAFGLVLGIILVSKFMNYCFKNYKDSIYMIIIGFSLSSVYMMFSETLKNTNSISTIIFGIIMMLFGYKLVVKKTS